MLRQCGGVMRTLEPLASQSVVFGPAVSVSPGSILEMQNSGPYFRHTTQNLNCNKMPRY